MWIVCFSVVSISLLFPRGLFLCCTGVQGGPEMSAKAPIYLKRQSRKGKKEKLRDLLSSNMISPPLGDFRHTIHIGSGSGADDLFGDLSFLQGKFHLLPGNQDSCQLSRTASVSSHPPASDSSPLLKNALSLPIIGGVQALTLPAKAVTPAEFPETQPGQLPNRAAPMTNHRPPTSPTLAPPPKPPRLHLDEKIPGVSRHVSLPASPNRSAYQQSSSPDGEKSRVTDGEVEDKPYLSNAGSLLSLHLDLGPSILEDVLQIMDNQRTSSFSGGLKPSGLQQIYT